MVGLEAYKAEGDMRRTNLALVETESAEDAEVKQRRDKRKQAVFDGVRRAYPGGLCAEGKIYITMTAEGEKGRELWIGEFQLNEGSLTQGDVLRLAKGHFSTVVRAAPRGTPIRLSRAVAHQLRQQMLRKIIEKRQQELAELQALFDKYTLG